MIWWIIGIMAWLMFVVLVIAFLQGANPKYDGRRDG